MHLLMTLALAASYDKFVDDVSVHARAWSEPAGSGASAQEAWRALWVEAGPSVDYDTGGDRRKGDGGVRRALRRAWDPTLPRPRPLSPACLALGWPEKTDDPVLARVDAPTCLHLAEHKALAEQFTAAAAGSSPRNPAPAFDPFMDDDGTLRSTYPLRSVGRSVLLLGWAADDPITPARAVATLGWDLTRGGDPSVTMSGLATLDDAHDLLKGYALESDATELRRIADAMASQTTDVDLLQLARVAYLSSIALMLRAVDPESALIAHGTVASRHAPLGSLGDLDGMKVPIRQFLKGAHRDSWEKAFQLVQIEDYDTRQAALSGLATELEEAGGPVAALVGAAASSEIEALGRWDLKIMVRRQEGCLIQAGALQALGEPLPSCPMGIDQQDDGLYTPKTAEELQLKGRWEEALWMPKVPPPTPG